MILSLAAAPTNFKSELVQALMVHLQVSGHTVRLSEAAKLDPKRVYMRPGVIVIESSFVTDQLKNNALRAGAVFVEMGCDDGSMTMRASVVRELQQKRPLVKPADDDEIGDPYCVSNTLTVSQMQNGGFTRWLEMLHSAEVDYEGQLSPEVESAQAEATYARESENYAAEARGDIEVTRENDGDTEE